PQSADYRFASGFTLYGYSLPESVEAGGSLPVGFWWRTQRDVDANLIQYVHLLDENGTMVAGEGSDQQPFGGRFPTADWPANMSLSDAWQVPLPADIPAGNYRVYMGLYDPSTVVRDPVTDGGVTALDNNEVLLGTVTVE
ncbi:MAG: hypothetical protein H7175_20300, partial [Burkholderiales bacterium]|nr:hypothetical protein [Anaerolineae bacterium]